MGVFKYSVNDLGQGNVNQIGTGESKGDKKLDEAEEIDAILAAVDADDDVAPVQNDDDGDDLEEIVAEQEAFRAAVAEVAGKAHRELMDMLYEQNAGWAVDRALLLNAEHVAEVRAAELSHPAYMGGRKSVLSALDSRRMELAAEEDTPADL